MNIYLVKRTDDITYDEYDSMVVCAKNEEEARNIHPSKYVTHFRDNQWYGTYADSCSKGGQEYKDCTGSWVLHSFTPMLDVRLIGKAKEVQEKGVILASFNAA